MEQIEDFLSFEGRISRMAWWIGIVSFGIVSVWLQSTVMNNIVVGGSPGVTFWFSVFWFAIMSLSLSFHVRRWHDHGKSGWWSMLFFVPTILTYLTNLRGLRGAVRGALVVNPFGGSFLLLSLVTLIAAIYTVVMLGILEGDQEPNSYGPPPVAGTLFGKPR